MSTSPVQSITDEQIAEIERRAADKDGVFIGAYCQRETILSLIARLRAAEKDAGRMQWMEDAWGGHSGRDGGFHLAVYMPKEGVNLRDMIDAAMTEAKP